MSRRLFVKAPDGSLVSRQTHKQYTHAVLIQRAETWVAWGWTKTPDRMLKAARRVYPSAVLAQVQP